MRYVNHLSNRLEAVASSARESLRRTPWRTLGIATGIGFLIGCMLTRPAGTARSAMNRRE